MYPLRTIRARIWFRRIIGRRLPGTRGVVPWRLADRREERGVAGVVGAVARQALAEVGPEAAAKP